jgi:putative ABC transport system permease protein
MSRGSRSERIYRRLLRLFPVDFREEYRDEMEELFRLQHRQARDTRNGSATGRSSTRGRRRRLLRLWVRATVDLARSAPREHWDALVQDVRFALRGVRRAPGFTAIVLGTFALALGANTAIFTVADATLLRPLPFANEDRLVRLVHTRERPDGSLAEVSFSRRDFHAVLEQAESVVDATAQVYQGPALGTGDGVERVVSIGVSGSWFRTLGVRPALGRTWDAREETAGRESRLVVLSDELWRRQLGADPSIVGRTILLDGAPHTVIGVMPPGFAYPYRAELWRLWDFPPDESTDHNLNAQARLEPGVSLAEAQAELDLISERQARAYPEVSRGYRIVARPTRENLIEGEDRLVLMLLTGVGLLLLIAGANVLSLLMARTVARSRELAVRASLGASLWRRARQLMTENVVLALLGGGLGLALAASLRRPLTALLPGHVLEIFGEVPFDQSAVWFTLGLSVLLGAAVGLFATWSARRIDLRSVLHGSLQGPRGHRLLDGMVIAETALTVTLLVGALFLSLDLYRIASRDSGFTTEGLVAARLSLPEAEYGSGEKRLRMEQELIERIRALPGVDNAAICNLFPYDDGNWLIPFQVEGEGLPREQAHVASLRQVTRGYFETLGIPVLHGRAFETGDRAGTMPVAVVDRALAERYWPDQDPVGRILRPVGGTFDGRPLQVVGVVGDVDDPRREPVETVYLPMAQSSVDSTVWDAVQPVLALRTAGPGPASVLPGVRAVLRGVDPGVPLFDVRTSAIAFREAVAQERLATTVALLFAGFGLLLAALGTYGVVAYTVSRGVRDFGVRLALGASRGSVLRGVLLRGGRLTATGVVLGLLATVALSRWLGGSLQAVDPTNPGPYATVAALLVILGLAACLQPALRATRTDPAETLRET